MAILRNPYLTVALGALAVAALAFAAGQITGPRLAERLSVRAAATISTAA